MTAISKDPTEFDETMAENYYFDYCEDYTKPLSVTVFIKGARWQFAQDQKVIAELRAEIERSKALIEIAGVLITNDNAIKDWEYAKRIRVM